MAKKWTGTLFFTLPIRKVIKKKFYQGDLNKIFCILTGTKRIYSNFYDFQYINFTVLCIWYVLFSYGNTNIQI